MTSPVEKTSTFQPMKYMFPPEHSLNIL